MVYVFLADGFEEVEALATADILRRAGIKLKTVGVTSDTVTGSHGITVTPDCLINNEEFSKIDAIVLPGGMPGTTNLGANEKLCGIIENAADNGVLLAAICAAPSVYGKLGLLESREYTCYPGFESEAFGGEYTHLPVCTDQVGIYPLITANGPAAAFDFAFAILNYLTGSPEKSVEIAKSMQMDF